MTNGDGLLVSCLGEDVLLAEFSLSGQCLGFASFSVLPESGRVLLHEFLLGSLDVRSSFAGLFLEALLSYWRSESFVSVEVDCLVDSSPAVLLFWRSFGFVPVCGVGGDRAGNLVLVLSRSALFS